MTVCRWQRQLRDDDNDGFLLLLRSRSSIILLHSFDLLWTCLLTHICTTWLHGDTFDVLAASADHLSWRSVFLLHISVLQRRTCLAAESSSPNSSQVTMANVFGTITRPIPCKFAACRDEHMRAHSTNPQQVKQVEFGLLTASCSSWAGGMMYKNEWLSEEHGSV